MRSIALVFLFFLTTVYSCKEDSDDVFPTILISSPSENAEYRVLEPVPLTFTVTDNKKIENVRVSLTEVATGRSVLNSLSFNPSGSSFTFDQNYSLSDSLLNTGTYSFRVDASDGSNSSTSFASIFVRGINKRSLGIITALQKPNSVEFIEIDKNQSQQSLFTTSSGNELGIDSRNQQLWFSKPKEQKIAAFDLKANRIQLDVFPNSNGQADRILDAELAVDKYYVSTDRGIVQAFSSNYQDVFTYNSPTGFRVNQLFPVPSRMIVKEADQLGNNQSLFYLFSNGAIETRIPESSEVVGISYKQTDPTTAHMFVNTTLGFDVRSLDLETGLSSFLATKNNIDLREVIRMRDFEFLLITDSQVYFYNLSTSFLREIISAFPSPKVAYDEVDRQIIMASGNTIRVYDSQQLSLVYTLGMAYPINDIAIHYNR